MVKFLLGEKLARNILLGLKSKKARGLSLAVIQVGDNPVSLKYIAEKEKAAKDLDIGFRLMLYPNNVSETILVKAVQKIGKNPKVSGMIVQLPLPKHLNTQLILDAIPPHKDVDVLSSFSFAEFVFGALSILPPTVAAIALLIKETLRQSSGQAKRNLEGTQVAVVGAGRLVGLPVSLWLTQQGAIVSLIQKGTRNAPQLIKKADIVVSGVGKAGLITGTMIKKGSVIIDAGTSVESGPSTSLRVKKIQGDVDFKSVSKKAGYLSPVPGGVGPLTVACLFQNLFSLSRRKFNAT